MPCQIRGLYQLIHIEFYSTRCVAKLRACTVIIFFMFSSLSGCLAGEAIETLGCTNGQANNYDENASKNDDSCDYDLDDDGVKDMYETYGCTDNMANNYVISATEEDNTCDYDLDDDGVLDSEEVSGCTDSTANNYVISATEEDNTCDYDLDDDGVLDSEEVSGCTDSTANNYLESATDENNSCDYDLDDDGVLDSEEVSGCTDSTANNYLESATEEDGSCDYRGFDANSLLDEFYDLNGGRDDFPESTVSQLEALIYGVNNLERGNWSDAETLVRDIFEDYPTSDSSWYSGGSHSSEYGYNIGSPTAYYGLRMLDQILELGEQETTGTLQMTAVVATCAEVSRPTLPDMEEEVLMLEIAPEIIENDSYLLDISTGLFRHWIKSITGGLEVNLVVHEMDECTTVGYTDDGSVIVSYPDSYGMIDSVPDNISLNTDFWWVIAPSGVPGDGSDYDRHFITGGMGVYGAGLPLFLSDDGWFVRKVAHLGSGPYSEIEVMAYQPQWFQHEFMHHLFRSWPEFGLEDQGHQWFNRSTWPDDFEGEWEPDFYYESIVKRFLNATPSLSEVLSAPDFVDPSTLNPLDLEGTFVRQPEENNWHNVTITYDGTEHWWTNAAGVSWSLEIRNNSMWSGSDCPYGESEVLIEMENNVIIALWFNGERYEMIDN
jgi:hypothetical protein